MTQDDGKLLGALALGIVWGIYLFFKGFRECIRPVNPSSTIESQS